MCTVYYEAKNHIGLCIRKGLEPDIDRTVIILSCAIFEVVIYFVRTFVQAFQNC
jgi:hypothetical protein